MPGPNPWDDHPEDCDCFDCATMAAEEWDDGIDAETDYARNGARSPRRREWSATDGE